MVFDKPKASSAARGYGPAHRAEQLRRFATHTEYDPCSACSRPLGPKYGRDRKGRRLTLWNLPHTPDRTGYLPGLQHRACNVSEGSSRGAKKTNAQRRVTARAM
jgi:hypothetical protein